MLSSQLVLKTSAVTLLRVGNAALNMIVLIVLARMIGAAGVGVYSYLVILLTLLLIPFSNGAHTLVLKLAAEATTHHTWSNAKGAMIASLWAAIVFALLAGGLVVAIAASAPSWLPHFDTALVPAIMMILFFDGTSAVRSGFMRGLDFPVRGQLAELLIRPAVLLCGFAVLYLLRDGIVRVGDVIYVLLAASALAWASGLYLAWRSAPPDIGPAEAGYDSGWISSVASFAAKGGIGVLNTYIDILLLGVLLISSTDIGVYRVAAQIAVVSGIVYMSINSIATQAFAVQLARNDMETLSATARASARIAFAASLPLPVIIFFFGEPLITLVFGVEFSAAAQIALILLAGQMINSWFGSAASLLTVSDRGWTVSRWFAYGAILNATLCFALIPVLGMAGAAIASVSASFVLNLVLWMIARRELGIDTSVLGPKRKVAAR